HRSAGRWGWGKDNPFYGTRPLRALIVANLVLNNWDFGVDQNRIYKMKDGANDRGGAAAGLGALDGGEPGCGRARREGGCERAWRARGALRRTGRGRGSG